jgi:hypothetical protein
MDINYLYKLASLLDSKGKYLEADAIYDQMTRLAAPDGRGVNQGRARPRDNRNFRLTPQQIQQRLYPNAPGLVPAQSALPAAPQAPRVQQAPTRFTPQQLLRQFQSSNMNIKTIEEYLTRNNYPKSEFIQYYNEILGEGKYQYDIERYKTTGYGGPNLERRQVKPSTRPQGMSDKAFRQILKSYDNPQQLDDYLKTNADKESFVKKYNEIFGQGAYEQRLRGGAGPARQQARGQQPGEQASGRPGPGSNSSGSTGRGTNTGTGAGASNNTGRPGGPGSGPGGAGPRTGGGSGTAGNASAGGGSRPGGGSSYRGPEPKFDPIPKDFNPITAGANAAKYRLLILQNPGNRPGIAARLELLVKRGLLDPKTGNWTRNFSDLQMSELERFYSKLGRAQDGVSDAASAAGKAGRAGAGAGASSFSPASFARTLNTTKVGQKLVTQLYAANKIFTNVVAKIPPPALKLISKIKFVFIFLNFARFIQALLNGTLEYKQTIEFIAACASIYPPVLATIGLIPIVGPGLVIAIGAVNLGAADVVEFFGNPEAGLNYMGFQITGPSARRKTDQIDFSTVDVSTLDKSVQNALTESVPLIKNGLKIREILVDPGMVQRHPWLSKRDDIRFTQFSGALGTGGFYKQNKQQSNVPANQEQNEGRFAPSDQTIMPSQPRQQGQSQQGQQGQPKQEIKNYNDLLYKAYVDVVQTTNVTLENLVNFKDQIISKINALAPSYPSINSQQSIQMLENRIRKYSNQAKPA